MGNYTKLAASLVVASMALTTEVSAQPLHCADDQALGLSRIIEIDPAGGPRIGTYQYPSTLELEAKEVVLTFDDGPRPESTLQVLDVLDDYCVKGTFFEVGRRAALYPEITREVVARGHTLGSHTWSHPANLKHLRLDKAKREIERGFAALRQASGGRVAPFFRYPGLNDSPELNEYLAQRGIAVISRDIATDDWLLASAKTVVKRTIARLEREGKGILLFHDRRLVTVKALPLLLDELKQRGFRVVHIVAKAQGIAALRGASSPAP